MARRFLGSLTAVVLATGVVACGGGDESDLADATNATCNALKAAATKLQNDLVRGAGDDETAAVKAAITTYVTAVRSATEQLEQAHAAKTELAFQQQAVAALKDHASTLRSASGGSKGTPRAEAIERLTASASKTGPMIPAALLDQAPDCQQAAR